MDYRTAEGEVTVIDFMPPRTDVPDLCRIVVGKRGRVRMRTESGALVDRLGGGLLPRRTVA